MNLPISLPREISRECSLISAKNGTCVSNAAVAELQKIVGSNVTEPKIILEKAKHLTHCDTERCVINSDVYRDRVGDVRANQEILASFKIDGPTNVNLLNNFNIDGVLKQWSLKFHDFYPYNFCMLDFATAPEIANKPNLLHTVDFVKEIKDAGYKTAACVVNSDKYRGNGQHWMAIFIDMRMTPWTIEFFNSVKQPIAVEFITWMTQLADKLNFFNKTELIKCNKVDHQKTITECGVYSLYYIWARLNDVSYQKFQQQEITDFICFEFRQHLFQNNQTAPMKEWSWNEFAQKTKVKWEPGVNVNEIIKTVGGAAQTSRKDSGLTEKQFIVKISSAGEYEKLIQGKTTKWPKLFDAKVGDVLLFIHDENRTMRNICAIKDGKLELESIAKNAGELKSRIFVTADELKQSDIPIPFSLELKKDSPRLPYRVRTIDTRFTLGWGQRKLLLTEILFLTKYAKNEKFTCVYAGAAPGQHIEYLSSLFPKITWILYDPAEFVVAETDKIKIHNTYFTITEARKYTGAPNLLFISDLRSSYKGSIQSAVGYDMDLQQSCYLEMRPAAASLKFKLPFHSGKTSYLAGDIYFQPWAPTISAETRLFVTDVNKRMYDNTEYEEQMFRFNLITRQWQTYPIIICDDCWDCAAEAEILRQYLALMEMPDSILKISNEITAALSPRTLISPPHGVFCCNENKLLRLWAIYSAFRPTILNKIFKKNKSLL